MLCFISYIPGNLHLQGSRKKVGLEFSWMNSWLMSSLIQSKQKRSHWHFYFLSVNHFCLGCQPDPEAALFLVNAALPFCLWLVPNPCQPLLCSRFLKCCHFKMLYKWNRTVCNRFGTDFFHLLRFSGSPSSCFMCQQFLRFYCWVVFYGMDREWIYHSLCN